MSAAVSTVTLYLPQVLDEPGPADLGSRPRQSKSGEREFAIGAFMFPCANASSLRPIRS
jgi:hypothetical protein